MQEPLPNQQIRDILDRLDSIERLMRIHLGPQQGAISSAIPHPQLSAAAQGPYTSSNYITDRTYDADTATVGELSDVVGTLLADLKLIKIIG